VLTRIATLIPLLALFVLAVILVSLKPKTWLEWIFAVWFTFAFSLFHYITGAWFLLSFYIRYGMAGLVLVAIFVSFLRLSKGIPFTNFTAARSKFTLASYLVPTLIFSVLSVSAIQGYLYSGPAVSLEFPLKDGTYYIAQAGGTSVVNAHHPYGSQIYSIDILQLNGLGRNAVGINQKSLEQYAIFGSPIYSPCDGMVSAFMDGLGDLPPGSTGDTSHAAGNHVYIDCQKENVQVLLAHMKKGSLVVKEGFTVKTGDLIGQVGNSGNTSEPHLHIHARRGGTTDKLISGIGVPILFNGHFLVRNDIVND
jgi:hypothetical protein